MLYSFVSHPLFIRNNTLKLDWQGQRTKKPQWLAFLNKDSFLLARVVLSRELLNMLYIFFFLSSFPNIFSRQKEKPISSCLAASCAVTKRRRLNHGYVLSVFYQVLSFTKKQLCSSMFYVKSLEKAGFKLWFVP